VYFGELQKWDDNTIGQQVYLPHVWVKPGEAVPICLDCGIPFEKTGGYLGMVGFQANCMDKHDSELRSSQASRSVERILLAGYPTNQDLTGRRGVAQDRQLGGGVGRGEKSAPSKRLGF